MARSLLLLAALVTVGAAGTARAGCRVALVPGAFAAQGGGAARFLTAKDYFADYARFFESKACEVKKIEFPPDATIEERALVLRDQVERFATDGAVVLVAHSQGGLDARFALQKLQLYRSVSRLITIGTPHHGTPAASWAEWHRKHESVLYWLLRAFGDYDLRELRFLGELTLEFLTQHEAHFEAVPAVRYASAAGVCRTSCDRRLRFLSWWTKVGMGDGLVPRESQQFGESLGEFDLDHLSEVGADSSKTEERARLLDAMWNWVLAGAGSVR